MTDPDHARPCDGCGLPIPRRWLLGSDWCGHCSDTRSRVDHVVAWQHDDRLNRRPADPLQALADLHLVRVTANQLIRRTVRDAVEQGAS